MSATMVSKDNSSGGSEDDSASQPPRLVFLSLIMLLACVANLFLLYAVVQSRKVRQSVQTVIIMNLMAVCLADCFLNMSLVMGSLASGTGWGFSDALCKWHAFVMNLVLVETTLLLTVMACDRFLAVRFLKRYDSLISRVRLLIVIVFTWIQSLAFSFPFIFDTVKMTFRTKLHICTVSDETSLAFICSASVFCFLAPAIVIILVFFLIFRVNCKQQEEVKTIITQNHYSNQLMEDPGRHWQEMLSVKYVGVLCLLWAFLEIPYVITTYIQQYRFSHELTFSIDYPWGVDVAFIWMRFSFSAVFPCATFICKKDLWQCCKECVICHRSNSVLDIQVKVNPNSIREVPPNIHSKSKDRDQLRLEPPNQLAFNVPVLFATSDGIHIETPHSDESDSEDQTHDYKLKGRQLDVGDNTIDNVPMEDTSDYDSSIEAECSSSLPLSARHIRGALESGSLPDLATQGQNDRGVCLKTGDSASFQGVDSGLELSGYGGSSSGKPTQSLNDLSEHDKSTGQGAGAYETSISRPALLQKERADPMGPDQIDRSNEATIPCEAGKNIAAGQLHGTGKVDSDSVKDVKLEQSCAPSRLPKVQGRLQPLKSTTTGSTLKVKTRKGVERENSRRRTDTKTGGPKANMAGKNVTAPGAKSQGTEMSSKERPSRGHKRTMTSESEKALLSSNSSVEIQNPKTDTSSAGNLPAGH